MNETLALLIFPGLMAFAAASDLFTMTISNRVSLALLAGFLGLAILSGMSLEAIGWNLLAGLIALVIAFCFFAMGWIGGGDAKLAAATAVWIGFGGLNDYIVAASIIGGVLTLVFVQMRKMPVPHGWLEHEWFARLYDQKSGIPYGVALAAAGLLVYTETGLWHAAIGV